MVSGPEVVKDGGLVEVGQVGHVLTLFKLGRVDLLDLIPLEDLLVVTDAHLDLCHRCVNNIISPYTSNIEPNLSPVF